MEFISSHKPIKNTSICGTIFIENELEAGGSTPAPPRLKARHTIRQEGRKVTGVGPGPLGGVSEEKGALSGCTPGLGRAQCARLIAHPVLGNYEQDSSHLGWLEDHRNSQKGCGKPGFHS